MDRRTKKTRAAIYTAFTELLSKKKYSQITIREIIDVADIGRSTFYAHFETKDELLKSMCSDIFNEMFSANHNFSTDNPRTMIMLLLHHIKDNKKAIKGVFFSESGSMFESYFKDYFNNQIELALFADYDENVLKVPKDFLINHISGSFIEMVKWWIQKNMKQSPEDLTAYFIKITAPIVTQLCNSKSNSSGLEEID